MCYSIHAEASDADATFYSVKTRIQATSSGKGKDAKPQLSIRKLLITILRTEGIAGFYKGFGASMLNTFSMRMYTLHSPLPSIR